MSVSRFRSASDGRSLDINYGNKKASTVITPNTLLTLDSAGQLIPAVAATTRVVGVALSAVVATDDNYATTDEIQYDAAKDGDEFIMDVDDASTAGFVAGVERSINSAGEIQAVAAGVGEGLLVRVKKVLTATDQAIVTLVTNQDSQST
jgi:hypothetical protein